MAIELNVQTLMLELKDISQWEFFASHLNGIEQATIEEIKDTGLSTEEQKRKLCEEWLKVYPKASWEDVISALQPETDENRAAEHIKHGILKRNITSLDLENAAPKSDASSKHVKSTEPDVPKTKTKFKPKQFNRAAFEGNLGKLEEIYEQPENKYFILHRSIGSELPIQAACRSKSRDCKEVVQTLIKWEKEFRGTQEYEDFLEKQKIKPEDPRRNDSRLCEKPQNGDIALQTAFKFNNPGAIEALLAASDCDAELMRNQLLHGSGDLKNTVQHVAAFENNEEMLEIVLDFYADLEWPKDQIRPAVPAPNGSVAVETPDHDTPVTASAQGGRMPKNHNHDTPVHLAAQRGNLKILELMYKRNKKCFMHCGRYKWTPLHTAVAYGQLEAVKTIVKLLEHVIKNAAKHAGSKNPLLKPSRYMEDLQAFKVKKIDKNAYADAQPVDPSMTPLTLACMFGHTEIVEFLLEVGKPIKNYIKAKAFKEAFNRKHTDCVKRLVIWSDNSKALENIFLSLEKQDKGAYNAYGEPEILYKGYFFNALIQHMPDVAMCVLDKCVELAYHQCKSLPVTNDHEYSDLLSISMTYDLIHPAGIKPEEDHPLKIMANTNNAAELLKHPVVASFIFNRWNSAYGAFNILFWLIYVIFLVITNVLLFNLPNPTSAYCGNGTANSTQGKDLDGQPLSDSAYIIFAALLLMITLIRLVIEAILAVKAIQHIWKKTGSVFKMDYLRDLANWILFLLTIVYSIIIINASSKSFCLSGPEWQVGVALMCLSWIGLILESRDFQIIGVQAYTFWRVLKTLALFIPFALLMFAAFGFSLYLLLYQYTLKGSPFSTEYYSFLSAYAMLAGESSIYDLLGLDINSEAQTTVHLQYEVLTVVFWSISLLFITIILTNVMIGLAVENISKIYQLADLQKLKLQVDHISERHRNLMGWMKFPSTVKEYKPNQISFFNILWKSVIFSIWGGSPFDSESAVNRLHSRLIAWPEPTNIICARVYRIIKIAIPPWPNPPEQVHPEESDSDDSSVYSVTSV